MTDEFAAIRAGDEQAYEVLFRAHYAWLCRAAYGRVDERDEAEDIVQDIFARLWMRRDRLPLVRHAGHWLYGAVMRGVLARMAERRRRQKDALTVLDETAPRGPVSPDQAVQMKDAMAAVAKAVSMLPPRTQLVFRTRVHYREIEAALVLGMKLCSVEKSYHRARTLLKPALAGHR